jgi:membrane protein involved in colicin uptake
MKGAQLKNPTKKSPRIAAAAAMVVCMLVAVAALGGVGHAQNVITAAQGAYGKKVTICHKGKKTISISKSAWPAHQRHGDTLGTCSSAAAKAAKAKKAKAAKAAKAKAEKAKAAKAEKAKAAKAKAEEKKAEHKPENPGKGKGKGGKG